MTVLEKIKILNLSLPVAPPSKGIYKKCVRVGNLVYVSGHVSIQANGELIRGKVGKDLSDEDGKNAARQCGLAILSTLLECLNDLEKVKRVIKILGMVNSTPDYENHPVVINGCSELFVAIWGDENGKGVRSAVGMGSLPGNTAVEIEAIFELVNNG
jgi:enamine deaminase RidA (YjgF/YER057c/UK114 family)